MPLIKLVNSIRNYLASYHMYVDNEWLTGCVEYLKEENSSLGEREIQSLAKEQWLLNDLKDICPGSLPGNLKGQVKTVLNGKFILQVNGLEDIGTPAYQQYLKLQKVNMENVEATTKFEDKVPNHRMIKLHLTDGVQEVSGIEYRPMRNLSCDITPGCKVLIKGPIECRRGIILLTESAIELLGGEVQDIAESNSLAGLLSSKLGLPIQPESEHNTTISQPRNTNIPNPHTQMPPAVNTFEQTLVQRPVAMVTSVQAAHNFADNDIDLNQIEALEAQIYENPTKRPLHNSHSRPEKKLKKDVTLNVDEFPDDDDLLVVEDEDHLREVEALMDIELNDSSSKVPIATTDIHTIRPSNEVRKRENEKNDRCDDNFFIGDDIFDIEEDLDKHNYIREISSEPFVYIQQINNLDETQKAGRIFKVKGQIIKLLSKLSVGKDGWSLRATIIDGTGSLDVDFTSQVLSKLVGYTPEEMNQLKKQMTGKPHLRQKAVTALQNAKESLQVLYCIIELTILEVPKITALTPFGSTHVDLLKRRRQDCR